LDQSEERLVNSDKLTSTAFLSDTLGQIIKGRGLVQVGGIGNHRSNKKISFKSGVSDNKGKDPRAPSRSRFGKTVTAANAAGAAV
jgi:hypothetical protein